MKGRTMGRARTIAVLLTLLAAGFATAAVLGGSSYAYNLVSSGSTADGNLSFLSASPTISSDKADYNPGNTVTLSGHNWAPGEVVHIFVNDDVGQSWSYTTDVSADAQGDFAVQFQLPTTFVATYSVSATGPLSGTATTSFTDGNVSFQLATADNAAPANLSWTVSWRKYNNSTVCDDGTTQISNGTTAYTGNSVNSGGGNAEPGVGNGQSAKPTNVTTPNTSVVFDYWSTAGNSTTHATAAQICVPGNNGGTLYAHFRPADSTPPLISPNVTGTLGNNGWYTSNVSVTWNVSDPDSAVTSSTGCGPSSVTSDTSGVTFTCQATSSGGTASQSVTIKRDATAPNVTLSFGRTPDHNGWYTSPVLISANGSDAMSGISSCGSASYSGPDDASASVSRSCTDNAGNTGSASATIKYDSSAPSATLSVTAGTAGSNGWYTSDVTVHTAGADSVSGPVTCTADQFQATETTGHAFNGSCTNDAGLSTSAAPLTVKLDETAPTSVVLAVTAGTLGSNGWYTSDVTLQTSGSEDISTPLTCTSDQHQTTETVGTLFNGSCTNAAGLTTNAIGKTIKLDKTGPSASLAVTDGTLGDNGWYITDVTIGTSGGDTISAPVSCTAPQHQTTDTTGAAFNGSCTNDAGLTTNAAPLTIKRDHTNPDVTLHFARGDDHNGWYTSPVDISGEGTDATSGIASCESATYSGPDTASGSITRSCKDNAGNTGSASGTIKYDSTGPTAALSVAAGTPGLNGWYTSDVTIHASGTDSVSGPVSCTDDQHQTDETTGATFNGSCTNDAGLSTDAAPLTVKLDKTGPSAAMSVTAGTAGANGWYTSDVTVHTAGADAISDNVHCTADQFQTTETAGHEFHAACTNDAGLSTDADPLTIKLDKTAPSANLAVTAGTLGANVWYTSDVTLSTTGVDSISGPVSCSTDQYQTIETTGQAFVGMCVNDAGLGANSNSITIKLDKTGPSAAMSVTAGTAGANGWYTSDVTVHTAGADTISGPATCTGDQFQTAETAGHIFDASCTNQAGLSTNAAALTVKLDKTAPSANLAVTAGTLGANGWYTSNVTISTSGVDSISSPVVCSPDQYQTVETTGQAFGGECENDAGLMTSATPLTVKLDKTGPSAAMSVTAGTLGSNGWYTSDVTVHTVGADTISGPATCTGDQQQTAETTGHVFNASCTNQAGLSTNAAPLTVKLDKTGPSASLSAAGTHGSNGWFTSNVTVSASGSDDISGPVVCDPDQFQTAETTGQIFSGVCTNDAGLTTDAAPLTVRLDKTGPSAAMSVTAGTAGSNGWYTSNVTVHTTGADSISSPVSCTADQFQTTETSGHVFSASCTNDAGLSTNAALLTVKLDKTGPTASLSAAGTHGTNGWFTSDVTVSTTGTDAISSPVHCTADQSQTAETAGQLFNGSCTNDAGLSTDAAPLTVKLDKTGPSAAMTVTAGTLGLNGWYTTNVTVHTSGTDAISSPVSCTADQFQTTETSGQVFNASCTNDAGLSTSAAPLTIKLDKTAPTISSTNDGQSYQLGSSQTVSFSCADPGTLSGLDACTGTVPNLSSLSTTPVGPHSYGVSASDNAGNTSSKTVNYTVGYRYDGFLQPINDTAHQTGLYESKFKLGSTVPVKFQLKTAGGTAVQAGTLPGFSYKRIGAACDSLTDTESTVAVDATSGSTFRWDSTLQGYIYNFSTKSLTSGEYRVYASIDDGSTQTVDLCMTR